MIELDLLVKKTIEALDEMGLINPLHDRHGIRHKNSIWTLVVIKCNGKFDWKENLSIYTMWKRDIKNYASAVTNELKNSRKQQNKIIDVGTNTAKG